MGLLHDIGNMVVPFEILSKPGKLSDYEHETAKNHAHVGYEALKEIDFPSLFILNPGLLGTGTPMRLIFSINHLQRQFCKRLLR